MKNLKGKAILIIVAGFIMSGIVFADGDWAGPQIRWMGPSENMCLKIDASHPSIGIRVDAEDETGVKQGTIWLKRGHHTSVGGIGSWTRIWGRTFATATYAPPVVSNNFMVRMLGRGQGEFTLLAEYLDVARPNKSKSFLHFSTDTSSPNITFTSPLNNSILCKDKNLLVKINAYDLGCGLKKVSLFFDRVTKGGFVGSDTSRPFEIIVPKARFTAKVHKLYAIAYDNAGKSTRVSITIKPTRICLMRMNIKR